jgi:hypothetical protein
MDELGRVVVCVTALFFGSDVFLQGLLLGSGSTPFHANCVCGCASKVITPQNAWAGE